MNDYDYDWRTQGQDTDADTDENTVITRDLDGKELNDGDSVHVAKDLKVKGMSKTLKRGTKVKIKLTGDPDEVDCRIGKSTIVLRTEFLKKA